MNNTNLTKTLSVIHLVGFGVLILIIIFYSNNKFVYDEPAFVNNLDLIDNYGISNKLITDLIYQFPGPLFQIVHWIAKPITDYSPLGMRLFNAFLLISTVFALSFILKKTNTANPQLRSLGIISIPMIWVIGGLSLSEMPAMFFLTASLLLFLNSIDAKSKQWMLFFALTGGLLYGMAISGRTLYLAIVPAFLIWMRHRPSAVIVFIIASLIIPAYIFIQWEGLTPKDVIPLKKEANAWFSFLGLGYLAITTLIIAPNWFHLDKKKYIRVLLALIVISILNVFVFEIYIYPIKSVIERYFSSDIIEAIGIITPSIIITLGIYFLTESWRNIYINKKNSTLLIFSLVSILIIVVAIGKSSPQFSSRYIAQAAPFIVIFTGYLENIKANLAMHLVGISIGIFSLISYLSG